MASLLILIRKRHHLIFAIRLRLLSLFIWADIDIMLRRRTSLIIISLLPFAFKKRFLSALLHKITVKFRYQSFYHITRTGIKSRISAAFRYPI